MMIKNTLRSLFALLLALALVLIFVSCSLPGDVPEGEESSKEESMTESGAATPLETPKDEPEKCKHKYENSKCIYCGEKFWISEDLHFLSNGDGTCRVSGRGKCDDIHVIIPIRSPKGEPVVKIGYRAFAWYETMESIIIHENITSIELSAFHDCLSLRSAVFEDPEGWYCDGKPINVTDPRLNVQILLSGEKLEKRG